MRLLESLDEESLAATIEEFLGNPKTAMDRAIAGRKSFEERFDLDRNAERLASLLRGEPDGR